jgi:predicted amidohydrolase YtcJ
MSPALSLPAAADLLLLNGKVWTCDPNLPVTEAVAIRENAIVAVGSSNQLAALAGAATQVIDLEGRLVLPGFNDAHLHFYIGGDMLTALDLRDVKNTNEFRERLRQYVATRPVGEWILHGNWDHENWSPSHLPTAALIDDITPNHPVWMHRSDGHMKLANTLAMRLAGVDQNTPDVPGGEIVRDASGWPTGIFKDAANRLVDHVIPIPSHAHIRKALLAAQRHALSHGVTSVQDMGVLGSRGAETMVEVLRVYQQLDREGDLRIRISAHLPLPEWQRLGNAGVTAHFNSGHLQIGAVKSFSDGSLGSTTAWFFAPYTDTPHSCGLPSEELLDRENMARNLRNADRAGLQIAIHAIGDRANHEVLNLCEQLQNKNGPRDRRIRIEHAQHLRPDDIPRFRQLNVIASMQPCHCIDDARWAEKRIGLDRAKTAFAFRSLLDAGAKVAFGSDWWVAPIDPLAGIYAAVTRRPIDGSLPGGWIPEQKITVEEAVRAYTIDAAYASGEEHRKGSLTAGKLADLVILSHDIFTIDPVQIANAKVETTIFDGKVVHQRAQANTAQNLQ